MKGKRKAMALPWLDGSSGVHAGAGNIHGGTAAEYPIIKLTAGLIHKIPHILF